MAVMGRLFSARVRAETRRRGETLFRRFGTQFVIDGVSWLLAIYCAALLRYDFDVEFIAYVTLGLVAAGAIACQLLIGLALSLYRGRFTYGSFEEIRALLFSVCLVALAMGLPIAIIGNALWLPRSIVFIALPLAFVLMGGARYLKRLYVEHRMKPGDSAEPTLVFGAGYMGSQLVQRMLTDRHSPFRPVALLDDNPDNAKRQIRGIHVMGHLADLPEVAQRTGAKVVIVAISRVDAALLREITAIADTVAVQVKVLPTLEDVLDGQSKLSDVRDIAIEDLIGRQPVDTDVESIAGYLTGQARARHRRRRLDRLGAVPPDLEVRPERADHARPRRDRPAARAARASSGHGLLDTNDVVLADIRDAETLREIFADAPARGRVPRRRAQAPADARAVSRTRRGRRTCSAR